MQPLPFDFFDEKETVSRYHPVGSMQSGCRAISRPSRFARGACYAVDVDKFLAPRLIYMS